MKPPTTALEPPYYAVIFSSIRTGEDIDGYAAMAQAMEKLAAQQPGYLGMDAVRSAEGLGITVSYWRDLDSIKAWKRFAEHVLAQKLGREKWYARYTTHIAKVERSYSFDSES